MEKNEQVVSIITSDFCPDDIIGSGTAPDALLGNRESGEPLSIAKSIKNKSDSLPLKIDRNSRFTVTPVSEDPKPTVPKIVINSSQGEVGPHQNIKLEKPSLSSGNLCRQNYFATDLGKNSVTESSQSVCSDGNNLLKERQSILKLQTPFSPGETVNQSESPDIYYHTVTGQAQIVPKQKVSKTVNWSFDNLPGTGFDVQQRKHSLVEKAKPVTGVVTPEVVKATPSSPPPKKKARKSSCSSIFIEKAGFTIFNGLTPFSVSRHDIVPPPPKKKFELVRPKEYRLKALLIFLFFLIVGGVTVIWLQYDRQQYEIEIARKIVFNEETRVFMIIDRAANRRVVLDGKLGVTLPFNTLPKVCSDNVDSAKELCLDWRNYGKLQIEYSDDDSSGSTSCFRVSWKTVFNLPLKDCYNLGSARWYGGATVPKQLWPIENQTHKLAPYLTGNIVFGEYGSVVERYWLTSEGVSIVVDNDVPLSLSMDKQICFTASYRNTPYSSTGNETKLSYTLCKAKNLVEIHKFTLSNLTRHSSHLPSLSLFRYPAWSTWGRFGRKVSQNGVISLANEIHRHGFKGSYLELHDGWEEKYGDLMFDSSKFPDPSAMVKILDSLGFNLTLWIHPFVNTDSRWFHTGIKWDYYVKTRSDNVPGIVKWWRGKACVIDFTNPNASDWFNVGLRQIVISTGVTSYRLVGGEVSWLPSNPTFFANVTNPDTFATKFTEIALRWGELAQVSVGANTQYLPNVMHIQDKYSDWGHNNGLKSVIPTVLTLGLHGYPYLSLHVAGGMDPYLADDGLPVRTVPDKELYIRWLALATFLPCFQFSVMPWQYDVETIILAQKFVKFHETFVFPIVEKLAKTASVSGFPIIRPMWWTVPEDVYAQKIDDQFMIGDDVIVAPSLNNGERLRNIYLIQGRWRDPRNNTLYTIKSGAYLRNYRVPLHIVPYFVRVKDSPRKYGYQGL